MENQFEIRELLPFTQAEIWPILAGYETSEIYTVEKSETDQRTFIDIRLVGLEKPYRDSYYNDFDPDFCQWYLSLLPKGGCFGAYQNERLVGFAIGEVLPEDHLLRILEFHVLGEFRRMGVGRALMEQVISKARSENLPTLILETQNTNVKAIRFYRSMGFSIESIDLSPSNYVQPESQEVRQVAFYMKRKL